MNVVYSDPAEKLIVKDNKDGNEEEVLACLWSNSPSRYPDENDFDAYLTFRELFWSSLARM